MEFFINIFLLFCFGLAMGVIIASMTDTEKEPRKKTIEAVDLQIKNLELEREFLQRNWDLILKQEEQQKRIERLLEKLDERR